MPKMLTSNRWSAHQTGKMRRRFWADIARRLLDEDAYFGCIIWVVIVHKTADGRA
jgi:hypothetical protein